MTSEIMRTIGLVAFSLAGAALILAVVLWITLDIKNVIGFLSGKNAEKAIRALREGKRGSAAYSISSKPGEAPAPKYAGNSFSAEAVDKTVLINHQDSDFGDETVSLDNDTRALDDETIALGDETMAIDDVPVPQYDDYMGTEIIDTPERSNAKLSSFFDDEETVILTTEPDEIEFDI